MNRAVLLLTCVQAFSACWLFAQGEVEPTDSAMRADTVVAADLELPGGILYEGRRVWISGELIRLGHEEIDEDFGVADATGIVPLDFDQQVIENKELIQALMQAELVEVFGVFTLDGHGGSVPGPRIVVSSVNDVTLVSATDYRSLATALGALALALLIGHLVARRRSAERHAAELASFTRELNRRDEILKAVGYAAERFLRNPAWADSLPDSLERIGLAAAVTRVSAYVVTTEGSEPVVTARGEWLDAGIAVAMGEKARADIELARTRLPRWREALLRHEVVAGATSELPTEEREYLEERGIRSLMAIPIRVSDSLGGLLVLTDHLTCRSWPDTEREALLIAAGLIGASIERTRAEAALAEVEDRFRQMAENIREVFFMTDAQTYEILYLSPAYEEIWGRSREETIRNPLAFIDAILPADRHVMLHDVEMSARGRGNADRQFEYRIRRPDGAIRWIRNRSFQIYDEDGSPHRVVGVCTDITEQKQLEEELRRANRIEAMGHLAAGIAHEINTPIQYIGGNLEFLQESHRDLRQALDAFRALLAEAAAGSITPERVDEITALVEETDIDFIVEEAPRASAQALDGVKRVSEIVRAMKEFSHPGSGQRIPTDLNHAILSTTTIARNEWKYVAELVTEFDPELPLVPCLPGEINQAILNLVVNAAHAIADRQQAEGKETPGKITVTTAMTGKWAEVRVSDTGTGIPQEIRPRIFDPFFTTKQVGRGTGQGLTFVHSIVVDKHGGTVTFETESGVGTTFILRLPRDSGAPDLSEAA